MSVSLNKSISLKYPASFDAFLDLIADEHNLGSRSEAWRRSIWIMKSISEKMRNGERLCFMDKDGKVREIEIFF